MAGKGTSHGAAYVAAEGSVPQSRKQNRRPSRTELHPPVSPRWPREVAAGWGSPRICIFPAAGVGAAGAGRYLAVSPAANLG